MMKDFQRADEDVYDDDDDDDDSFATIGFQTLFTQQILQKHENTP